MGELKKIFRPEFLNRIDEVHRLPQAVSREQIKEIVELMLNRLREQLKDKAAQHRADRRGQGTAGRRGLRSRPWARGRCGGRSRRMSRTSLADEVLAGKIPSGSTIVMGREDDHLVIAEVPGASPASDARGARRWRGAGVRSDSGSGAWQGPERLRLRRAAAIRAPGGWDDVPDCGEWNTLIEEAPAAAPPTSGGAARRRAVAAPTPFTLARGRGRRRGAVARPGWASSTGCWAGGLVTGSLVLVGGEPGIGKSTLLLQTLLRSASGRGGGAAGLRRGVGRPGEVAGPTAERRSRRAARSSLRDAGRAVVACLEEHTPGRLRGRLGADPLVGGVDVGAGLGVADPRGAGRLLRVAKESRDHPRPRRARDQEGDLAGPRVLEHMVDAVLAFEGDRGQPYPHPAGREEPLRRHQRGRRLRR